LRSSRHQSASAAAEVEQAALSLREGRPAGQVASITLQLEELYRTARKTASASTRNNRSRSAFQAAACASHSCIPTWVDFSGRPGRCPSGQRMRPAGNRLPCWSSARTTGRFTCFPPTRIPGEAERDRLGYGLHVPGRRGRRLVQLRGFGTRMAESVLLSLGYFSDAEVQKRKENRQPLPPRPCGSAPACAGRSLSWATPSPRCEPCARETSGPRSKRYWGGTHSAA